MFESVESFHDLSVVRISREEQSMDGFPGICTGTSTWKVDESGHWFPVREHLESQTCVLASSFTLNGSVIHAVTEGLARDAFVAMVMKLGHDQRVSFQIPLVSPESLPISLD
jgi:hypothetical protein